MLLTDKPMPSISELEETLFMSKLKLPKDARPKKAKSWANLSGGKSPPGPKSPSFVDTPDSADASTKFPSIGGHLEMVTGL